MIKDDLILQKTLLYKTKSPEDKDSWVKCFNEAIQTIKSNESSRHRRKTATATDIGLVKTESVKII
jgi:hypothetical protein